VTEKCPRCGSDLKVAPGIGPFCPNGACGVADDIKGGAGWQDQIHQAIEDGRNRKWAEAHPEIIAGLRDGSLVAVPREPTEAMVDAFSYVRAKEPEFGEHFDSVREFNRAVSRDIWRAMLTASAASHDR